MAGWTNRGKYTIIGNVFRKNAMPTNVYVALVTSAIAPTADINVLGDLTQIAVGNGYTTGGYQLAMNAVDFDVHTEDDTLDRGYLQIKDVVWTAAGGSIPSSGNGARYAVLTDDNVTVASRIVYCYWDLGSDKSVSVGNTITLQNLEIRANES